MKGKRQRAHPESVLLALRALGAQVAAPTDLKRALKEKQAELRGRVVEPVIVAWHGRIPAQSRRLPARARATLVLENGTTAPWPPRSPLPFGYHRLHVKNSGTTTESLIISAPAQATLPTQEKMSGVFAPLYALHSERNSDAGDLTDLGTLVEWMAERKGRLVSTLPLLANFLDEPFEPSPYSPISRLFWNEFYIDPRRAPEFAALPASDEAQALRTPIDRQPTSYVDYKTSMQKKRRVLEECAKVFFHQNGASLDEFQRFLADNPEVRAYAEFRARTDQLRRGWHDWPRNVPRANPEITRYHLYAQWLVQTQLRALEKQCRGLDCFLYLDLPLGLHRDSFDTWRYPHLFVKGMSGGAPPDPVFTTGQDWAFQPVHPELMRQDGYRYVIAYIRNHLRYARFLRIDHVMGLHRLYWIPEGLKGDRGLYVQYPAEEMYAILTLESHRAGAGIVGENLGVVPPEVNSAMRRHNVRELYVAQYETAVRSRKSVLRDPPAGCVASLNTHDLFPFQGFLDEVDIDERVQLGFITASEATRERKYRRRVRELLEETFGKDIFAGCSRFLMNSRASVVLYNMEDFWGETKAQNIPSTTREHANWRRRMRYSMERLRGLKVDLSRDGNDAKNFENGR